MQGPSGEDGMDGTQGPQGLQGPRGFDGTNGVNGAQGHQAVLKYYQIDCIVWMGGILLIPPRPVVAHSLWLDAIQET